MARDSDFGPEHHLSRLMTPALDPTAGAKAEPLSRLWPAVGAGTLVLALLNAQGLEKWTARLPESPVADTLIVAAQEWKDRMDHLGPGSVFDEVRKAFQKFRGQ